MITILLFALGHNWRNERVGSVEQQTDDPSCRCPPGWGDSIPYGQTDPGVRAETTSSKPRPLGVTGCYMLKIQLRCEATHRLSAPCAVQWPRWLFVGSIARS